MKSASNMIAKWYQNAASPPPNASVKIWDMPNASVGRRPVREMSVCSSTAAAACGQLVGRDGEAEAGDELRRGGRVGPGGAGRAVHREVEARVDDGGGDQGADGHERLHQHAAVADHPDLALLGHHLGRGAGGDERVEARQRPARDGDEHEREQLAGEDRAGALAGEVGDRLLLQDRGGEDQADRQQHDHADLHERRQVVAGGEQHPDRQDRGDEAVDDQGERQLLLREGQRLLEPHLRRRSRRR